jgi:hypothetical protein
MTGHYLILGQLDDLITGETLDDTHDERYRQKIARLLINRKGYLKDDIESRRRLQVRAGDNCAIIKIDFLIRLGEKVRMIIKYGPGSLVTRQRPLLAASRIIVPYQIPVAVITNGEDAQILDGSSAKLIGRGLDGIPSKPELITLTTTSDDNQITASRAEMESRILYCFEVDDSCPCDDNICKI